jgi:hypothetical protein
MEAPDNFLESLKIASPCTVSWEAMSGGRRIRHCGLCKLNVYNLSGMTRADAEELVRGMEGRVCVRLFRRKDGTVLTADCPVGFKAVRQKLKALAAFIGATLAVLSPAWSEKLDCWLSRDEPRWSDRFGSEGQWNMGFIEALPIDAAVAEPGMPPDSTKLVRPPRGKGYRRRR